MIDITMPLRHGMVHFPGDPEIEFETVLDVKKGDRVNLKRYSFGSHSGTHVDAPYHLFSDGKTTDELPADTFIGTAKVFAFESDIENLTGLDIKVDDIVLFKTSNNVNMNEFNPNHVSVLPAAAKYLVGIGVRTVGIDCLSIETNTALPVHRILLGAGIPIIEGLDLSGAEPGVYHMTAMIMRIENSDGAPLRAMLEKCE